MTALTYCALDRNRMGAGLALDEAGTVITTTDASDLSRTILGDLPAMSGDFAFECYHWSASRGDLSGLFAYGVAQPQAALDTYVGGEAISYGFKVADGEIWNDGASIATVDAQAERTTLGLVLALSPSFCTCTWTVNGVGIHTETLANGQQWLPAFSLGSDTAADVQCVVNFGEAYRFDRPSGYRGWAQQTAGLATLCLSIATEGFMSAATDTPATTAFGPFLLNDKQLLITRAPQVRPHRNGSRGNPASITVLRLDNSKGTFNALRSVDIKGSKVVLQVLAAPPGGVGVLATASTVLTAIIDVVQSPSASIVEVTLRDTLTAWDEALPMRVVPPFYDSSSAGRVLAMGLGPQRGVDPLVLDTPTRLYALGDAPMTNVTEISDMAAPLDPNGDPPGYYPALEGAGFTLQTDAVGRVGVDCSSVGTQAPAPGIDDILEGDGDFDNWTAGVPDGWLAAAHPPWPAAVVANGSIAQSSAFSPSALAILSHVPYAPDQGTFGYPVTWGSADLEPGVTYVFRFEILQVLGNNSSGNDYGFAILAGVIDQPQYWVTPYRQPLKGTFAQTQRYAFTYTVPRDAPSNLPVYLMSMSQVRNGLTTPTTQQCGVVIDNLTIERKGAFETQPMQEILLADAISEIIVARGGHDSASFSASDAAALDTLFGAILGIRKEDVPNTLDTIIELLDPYCAVPVTDEFGVVGFRQLADPEDLSLPVVAAFSKANIDVATFRTFADTAPGLTALYGARPMCTPYEDSDFVSDAVTAPPALKTAWKGVSQFLFTAQARLASEYAFARGADRYHLPIDVLEKAIATVNRWIVLWEQKRNFTRFKASYDGLSLGIGPSIAPQSLYYGHVITLDLPELGYDSKRMTVVETGHMPGAKKMYLTGWHA